MKVHLACVVAIAAALIGCGEKEVDPDPYGLSKIKPEPGAAAPSNPGEGPGNFTPGGTIPDNYPVKKSGSPDAATAPAPKADEAAPAKTEPEGLSQEEIDQIKKLPAEEQAKALAQVVCIVSGEHLGSMGTPVKVESDGKVAYLCCKGCVEDFQKDPAAALAKLEKK